MESTEKRLYEVTTQPDGKVALTYTKQSMLIFTFAGALLFLYWGITSGFGAIYSQGHGRGSSSDGFFALLVLGIGIFLTFRFFKKYGAKETITIIPREGLIFLGKQIPFRDIDGISIRVFDGRNYVFVNTGGKSVDVTTGLTNALALAIQGELLQYL